MCWSIGERLDEMRCRALCECKGNAASARTEDTSGAKEEGKEGERSSSSSNRRRRLRGENNEEKKTEEEERAIAELDLQGRKGLRKAKRRRQWERQTDRAAEMGWKSRGEQRRGQAHLQPA